MMATVTESMLDEYHHDDTHLMNETIDFNDEHDDNLEDVPHIHSMTQKIKILEDYDTDIEEDESKLTFDHSGRQFYVKNCRKAGVVPAGYFIRHMNDRELDMKHHGLGVLAIKPLCLSLAVNNTITKLDLTDNWLGYEGAMHVIAMLHENCFISDLSLSRNRLDSTVAPTLIEAIANNNQITHVNLSHNDFDDHSATHFAELVAGTVTLEFLDISHNNFGDQFGLVFGKALEACTTVKEMNLSWNHIRGKGTKGLCVGIGKNECILKLDLSWNGFGPVFGVQELGKALKINKTLEELNISNNRIIPEGAVWLGRGLTINTALKVLNIGQNPMQTAGCYAILNFVMKNQATQMQSIDFQDILVNQDFKDLLGQCKEVLPNLKVFTGTRQPSRPQSQLPMALKLKRIAQKQAINVGEYLKQFDDDNDWKITKEEFRLAIDAFSRDHGLIFGENEVKFIMEDLDSDGLIDFQTLNFEKHLPKPVEEPKPEVKKLKKKNRKKAKEGEGEGEGEGEEEGDEEGKEASDDGGATLEEVDEASQIVEVSS